MKIKTGNLMILLLWISVFTSSFDIFLSIDFAGLTVRLAQMVLLPVFFVVLIQALRARKVKLPYGFGALLMVFLLNTLFLSRCIAWKNGLGYECWFLMNILLVFVYVYYMENMSLNKILRWYILSFVLMAVWGLVQKLFQYAGIYLFVTQKGRINGFTFEPSYYSTYMIVGWIILAYLWEKKNYSIVTKKEMYIYIMLITLAMILSTSKIGWGVMIFWVIWRILSDCIRASYGKLRKKHVILAFMIPVLLFIFYRLILVMNTRYDILAKYLSGSGLFGSSSHSLDSRLNMLYRVIECIKESPWIGVSFGGVDPAIARYRGIEYGGNNGAAMCVSFEIILATGMIGFVFFIYYLLKLVWVFPRKYQINTQEKDILMSAVWGLVIQFLMLQINQNIMRHYFWVTVAIVTAIENNILKRIKENVNMKSHILSIEDS